MLTPLASNDIDSIAGPGASMDDSIKGYIRDMGIAGDPISINGRPVSVREIKSRAGHGR